MLGQRHEFNVPKKLEGWDRWVVKGRGRPEFSAAMGTEAISTSPNKPTVINSLMET
jgi:hypothetical protein